ncbi:MAG: hypothetical protein KUG77_13640 [Nannocystaceae bacterium]|nr:hypothetical protein [Nannocystaceae bacterium]
MDLVTYRQMLETTATSVQGGELFQQAIQGALDFSLFENERDLGQQFGVSRSQVNRWKNGRSLPGQASRKTVYSVLKNRATRKIKSSQQAGTDPSPPPVLEATVA